MVSYPRTGCRDGLYARPHEDDARLLPAEIFTLVGTGGHLALLLADRVVGQGATTLTGHEAGVWAALGRSLKSIRCKRGRGTIVDHQMRRIVNH